MTVPYPQAILAILAFAIPAFFFNRLRLVKGEKGPPRYYSTYGQIAWEKIEAARAHMRGLILRLGWAWLILCAPLLTYLDGGFSIKRYIVILLGCVLFGIILSAVVYSQMQNFPNVDPEKYYSEYTHSYDTYDLEKAIKKAHQAAKDSNRTILIVALAAGCLLPLWQYPAAWASGFSMLWYLIFVGVFAFLLLLISETICIANS